MTKILCSLLAAAMLSLPAFAAEETRTIHLIQDDAQVRMVTKTYNLKNLKASDIGIYVQAAVRRYTQNSQLRMLNFKANNQQTLIVTTAEKFIPYVDQIVEVLDRGTKKNEFGSAIVGPGYRWKTYSPKYRASDDLILPADAMLSGMGNVYSDNGTLWLKDDLDDVNYALEWVGLCDRPIPQATVTLRYYSVRESTLRDVGIDYLAWKNGPGMRLGDFAYSTGRIAWDKVFNEAVRQGSKLLENSFSAMSWSYGGCFTAPAFDMTFVRILQQAGNAKILATATVNVMNGQEIASMSLVPTYNAITKDDETHASSVIPIQLTDFAVNIYNPVICFAHGEKDEDQYGFIPSSPEFYAKNQGALLFSYDMASSDAVEANNYGTQVGNGTTASSSFKTISFGKEQILNYAVREFDLEQTTGVPFLCQLPILKYIFGTTTTMKEKSYIFVTVEANLVHPEAEPVKQSEQEADKAAQSEQEANQETVAQSNMNDKEIER